MDDLTHYLLPQANMLLCTENLTPFLSLLPSKGISGLSSLLAQPNVVFSWGFKTEGIEVIMPTPGSPGRWRGWWEGVVDLTPKRGMRRDFSIEKLFRKTLPAAFPESEASTLRLIMPRSQTISANLAATKVDHQWIDGKWREVHVWDLLSSEIPGQDIDFHWDDETHFEARK